MTPRPDPPELAKACDMLREIYWREYGRGWKAAIDGIKKGLEQQALIVNDGEDVRK